MMHFIASIHFTWHLWEILLHMTSINPLLTSCRPTPPARHRSLSHQISPSGRERRKVKSPSSECSDLWTSWPVHTWASVFVTVCDSKGLTKECMKHAGTSDNWAICCKVTAEQKPHDNLVLTALTRATDSGFSKCVRKWYGPVLVISPYPLLIYRKQDIYSTCEKQGLFGGIFYITVLLYQMTIQSRKSDSFFMKKRLGNITLKHVFCSSIKQSLKWL